MSADIVKNTGKTIVDEAIDTTKGNIMTIVMNWKKHTTTRADVAYLVEGELQKLLMFYAKQVVMNIKQIDEEAKKNAEVVPT